MVDLLILGSGVAGLSAAVRAAALGLTVTVCTKGELQASATWYAQGGVAAAMSAADSADLHASDTFGAGGGLCDPEAVAVLVAEGPDRVRGLIRMGAAFDRSGSGADAALALTREGGHSIARIVHAGGDATGAEIERALVATVRATAVEVHEHCFVSSLVVEDGRVVGAAVRSADGVRRVISARNTLLATGGAGQCFAVTTNPKLSTGDGIAMAGRVGAALADIEFMQFHPTALDHPAMPRPLLSEALRGEGAILRDRSGVAFMVGVHPRADLAPRDVVARAITERLVQANVTHLWLDATPIADFPERFPTVWESCRAAGLDPRAEWLPVAPAAHYLSGGVATDLDGASTIPGLWACGEVACSGVHGANRLASNSLLDGLVFGPRAAEAIAAGRYGPSTTGVLRGLIDLPGVQDSDPEVQPGGGAMSIDDARTELQRTMTLYAGVLRSGEGLATASERLERLCTAVTGDHAATAAAEELRNLVYVATRLIAAASLRVESRGTHTRTDAPEPDPEFLGRFVHVNSSVVFCPLPQHQIV
ncbi:MAG: L-aspartate oxidase [Acidimicrobiia bacterium]